MPPVADHASHPSTVERPDARNGCFNRPPYKDGYYAPDGYIDIGTDADGNRLSIVKRRFIPHEMTFPCQTAASGQAATDRKCQGCKHMESAK